eukprot:Gb_26597 [translate_table: standard]
MGSSSSRPSGVSTQGRPRNRRLSKRAEGRIRPLIRSLSCGTVFPRYRETEELPAERHRNFTIYEENEGYERECAIAKDIRPSTSSSENGYRSSRTGLRTSGESSNSSFGNNSGSEMEMNDYRLGDSRRSETTVSCQENGTHYLGESGSDREGDLAGTDSKLQIEETTHMIVESTTAQLDIQSQSVSSVGIECLGQMSMSVGELEQSSSLERGGSSAIPDDLGRHSENCDANADSLALNSTPVEGQLIGDESVFQDSLSRNPSSREGESRSEHNIEVANLSSNEASSSIRDISSQEARRNSRRRLWDALTRATSRRRTATPTIVLSAEEIDDLGSSHDRWLLDFSGELYDDAIEDYGGLITGRSYDSEERRWHFRSQVWALQRLRGGSDGIFGHSRFCASGLHLDGRCSCEAYVMTEETSTQASISRIVMLAEALFEVLDEIHRQSVALSQSTSLSLVSLPAPESVVDSFPLRNYKKSDKSENVNEEVAQCYICLADYEEGDKIRVLPCHHEYHMACVDKWLKEIHRVCPLCRGNVCEHNGANIVASSS